jgi:rod shape-determining protein MreD
VRIAGYIVLILLCAVVEATAPRVFWLDAARPLLIVALVLHFALRLNTIEGALLALGAGFVEDATAGYPTGLASFTCVAIFVGARLALAGLRADGRLFEAMLAFVLAAAYHVVTTALGRLFGPPVAPLADLPWMGPVLWSALATSLATPLVLWAAGRVERLEKRPAGML